MRDIDDDDDDDGDDDHGNGALCTVMLRTFDCVHVSSARVFVWIRGLPERERFSL